MSKWIAFPALHNYLARRRWDHAREDLGNKADYENWDRDQILAGLRELYNTYLKEIDQPHNYRFMHGNMRGRYPRSRKTGPK